MVLQGAVSLQNLAVISGVPLALFIFLIIWQYAWKIVALWVAARKRQLVWFVILALPISTVGLLEILYIFLFSKIKMPSVKEAKQTKRKRRM